MYVCMYVFMCVCVCVCVRVRACDSMHVCVYVFDNMHICVNLCVPVIAIHESVHRISDLSHVYRSCFVSCSIFLHFVVLKFELLLGELILGQHFYMALPLICVICWSKIACLN
jgi:hypothetical protein